jgi:hypothetical protein
MTIDVADRFATSLLITLNTGVMYLEAEVSTHARMKISSVRETEFRDTFTWEVLL